MRIALITLALVALGFIGTIIYSISGREGSSLTLSRPTKTLTPTIDSPTIAIETLKYQIKTDEKLDQLTRKIEALDLNTDVTRPMTTASLQRKQDG